MKKRFGNAVFTGTLSQGLYPAQAENDTLAHTVSITFEFQEGVSVIESVTASIPSVQTASLTVVVAYRDSSVEDTASASLPTVQTASLTTVIQYVNRDIDSDSVTASIPAIQSATLTVVVRVHELYDAVAARPEDTLQHTSSWEFTLT